jgi:hypothetical protein
VVHARWQTAIPIVHSCPFEIGVVDLITIWAFMTSASWEAALCIGSRKQVSLTRVDDEPFRAFMSRARFEATILWINVGGFRLLGIR